MQEDVKTLVSRINRRKLETNKQRVLFTMLTSKTEWVRLSTIKVPGAGAQLRALRKAGFAVEWTTASKLGRKSRGLSKEEAAKANRQTYYRINPDSVTLNRTASVFEGVVDSK